jgi:hypothetical protein
MDRPVYQCTYDPFKGNPLANWVREIFGMEPLEKMTNMFRPGQWCARSPPRKIKIVINMIISYGFQ